MNTRISHQLFAAALLTASSLSAQEEASTLLNLCHRAPVIAQVKVLHSGSEQGQIRLVLRTQRRLLGKAPASFELYGPAGRVCGTAFHGVHVGSSYLAFLTGGPTPRLIIQSARTLISVSPQILTHTQDLLGAATATQRLGVLAAALSSTSERVRRDAAASLPRLPDLARASLDHRTRILTALRETLATADATAFSLVATVDRLGETAATPTLVDAYLSDQSEVLIEVLHRVIPRLDAAGAIRRIESRMPSDLGGRRRALALLGACPGPLATDCLQRLASHPDRSIASQAATALQVRSAATPATTRNTLRFRAINPRRER